MSNIDPAMEGGKEFKPLKFKLGKPGDIIKGTLIANEYKKPDQGDPYWEADVKVQLCKFHDLQADEAGNYIAAAEETVLEAGQTIKLYGGRKEIDELLANCKPGEIIGVQFVEFKKGKGPKPFKVVLAKSFGPDPDYKEPVEEVFPGSEEVAPSELEKELGV